MSPTEQRSSDAVGSTREPNFLLARAEKRALRAIAARLPRWVLLPRLPRRRRLHRLHRDRPGPVAVHAAVGRDADRRRLPRAVDHVYLESQALGRFSIGYGLIGPTEMR